MFAGRRGPVDSSRLYGILQVKKTDDDKAIRQAYRQLARQKHPDKGGSAEEFKNLHFAYEILSDPEKRSKYDAMGEEFIEMYNRGGAGVTPDPSSFAFRRPPAKGKDLTQTIQISLEDILYGKTIRVRVSRNRTCAMCRGSGAKHGAPTPTCTNCKGAGMTVNFMQQGPFMTQIQQKCQACNGKGETKRPGDECPGCKGNKTIVEDKTLEVSVEKGSKDGDVIVLDNEADETPNAESPGDVVFQLQEMRHERFTRSGCNLNVSVTISLYEALVGTSLSIPYFTGEVIHAFIPADIAGIKPGDVRVVPEWGLPLRGQASMRGDLYVRFEVEYPVLTPDPMTRVVILRQGDAGLETVPDLEAIRVVTSQERKLIKETHERVLKETDAESQETNRQKRPHKFASENGGPPVACATQ